MKFGIKPITMDDIAKHLSISKKTIYQYFEDKDALVMAVCTYHITDTECHIEEIMDISHSALEQMLYISEYMRKEFLKINPLIFYHLQKFHPKAWAIYLEHKECNLRQNLIKNFELGVNEGHYRSDFDFEIMATLRIEQVQLAMNPELYPQPKYTTSEVQVQFLEHFVRGLLTLEGLNQWQELKKLKSEGKLNKSLLNI
jgi:AcrR family transcriptional regulator